MEELTERRWYAGCRGSREAGGGVGLGRVWVQGATAQVGQQLVDRSVMMLWTSGSQSATVCREAGDKQRVNSNLPDDACDGEESRNDGGATDGGLEYLSWCRFLGITGDDEEERHLALQTCD